MPDLSYDHLDAMFKTVRDAYGAHAENELPASVRSIYSKAVRATEDARDTLASKFFGGDAQAAQAAGAIVGAAGPALINMTNSILNHNDDQARAMARVAVIGIASAINPALGAGVAIAGQMMDWVVGGPLGAKSVDECSPCSDTPSGGHQPKWFGSYDLANTSKAQLPIANGDSRWLPWTNQVPGGVKENRGRGVKGNLICNDDCPIGYDWAKIKSLLGDQNYKTCFYGVGYYMQSRGWAWLPDYMMKHSPDTFDGAFAQQIAAILEQYINAQGPFPGEYGQGAEPWGPNTTISLTYVGLKMLLGWSAIHQGGPEVGFFDWNPKMGPVRLRLKVSEIPWTTTTVQEFGRPGTPGYQPAGQRQTQDIQAALARGAPMGIVFFEPPGRKLLELMQANSITEDWYLHTGPLIQPLADLFNASNHPRAQIHLRSPTRAHASPGLSAVRPLEHLKAITRIHLPTWGMTAAGGAVGLLAGGPVGLAAGVGVGLAIDYVRRNGLPFFHRHGRR